MSTRIRSTPAKAATGAQRWHALSTAAYGANAVFIPQWGKDRSLELILVMHQRYPHYKTHEVLDTFHGYISGAERFAANNHTYRVLGWEIDPAGRWWSFLYLPTARNDVRALVRLQDAGQGRLVATIDLENPSDEDREWAFTLYCAPGRGLELPGLRHRRISDRRFDAAVDGMRLRLRTEGMAVDGARVADSNGWINFPLNAEASYTDLDAVHRYKKRLVLDFAPVSLPAGTTRRARLVVATSGQPEGRLPRPPALSRVADADLPYQHALWEARHNQQYVASDAQPGRMEARVVPARQWYKYYLWDAGMTGLGVLERDPAFAERIIDQTPDPELTGTRIHGYGTYLPTAVYVAWELYCLDGEAAPLRRHYAKLRRLVDGLHALRSPEGLILGTYGCGADDNPVSFYAKAEIFAWDFRETLPINPQRRRLGIRAVGLTAHCIRMYKLLRSMARILGDADDESALSQRIAELETALERHLWVEGEGGYFDWIEGERRPVAIPWIYCLLPLLSGSVPGARAAGLLRQLSDPRTYRTRNGLVLVPCNSPYYRQDGYPNGSAWPPLQYFFWQAAYNHGDLALAERLASTFMDVYERNHRDTLCCWEQFRSATGLGAGNNRFSGFLTPVLALEASRRAFGRMRYGQDLIPLARSVRADGSRAELAFASPWWSGRSGFSVVLLPKRRYAATRDGAAIGTFRSDAHGFLSFPLAVPRCERTTLAITLV